MSKEAVTTRMSQDVVPFNAYHSGEPIPKSKALNQLATTMPGDLGLVLWRVFPGETPYVMAFSPLTYARLPKPVEVQDHKQGPGSSIGGYALKYLMKKGQDFRPVIIPLEAISDEGYILGEDDKKAGMVVSQETDIAARESVPFHRIVYLRENTRLSLDLPFAIHEEVPMIRDDKAIMGPDFPSYHAGVLAPTGSNR